MITVKRSEDRHQTGNETQKTWMTFNWDDKTDPLHNGFGSLCLLNEEILPVGTGFILHTHKDMVMVTYVQQGMIVSNGPLEEPSLVVSEEFQVAATGVGTKRNAYGVSNPESAHFFQSGFTPAEDPKLPGRAKRLFTQAERKGVLKLVASPDGAEYSLPIQQDVRIYSTFVNKGNHVVHEIPQGRRTWLHVVSGLIQMDGLHLKTGDGIGVDHERSASFTAESPTEILMFDLA
jgi:redox-sensitive bicupin YhaK (pirin superfamily)